MSIINGVKVDRPVSVVDPIGTGVELTDELLTNIWDRARRAPTAFNSQPLRVLFVRTGGGLARLMLHVRGRNRDLLHTCPAVAVMAADSRYYEFFPRVFPLRPELREIYEGDEARRTTSMNFNTAIQVGYFILTAQAQTLQTTAIEGFDKAALDADFFPDGRWRSVLLVGIALPGATRTGEGAMKLPYSEVIRWE
jgi:3-hydroxypropanoate dehydrogenase